MTIYRLTSPLTNEAQAFWTIREAIKQNKKAYSVELQLIPNSVITDKLPRTDAKLGSLSSLDEGGSRQNAPTTIAKTNKPNPTTKKQISQEQKKHFVITHLLIFITLNFANHFANSQKRIKYEKDTFRLYGFDSVAFWG